MMSMLIFTLLAALVLHPAESDSVDDNDAAAADAAADAAAADAAAADAAANAAAADAAAEDEDEDTKVLLNEYAHVLLLGENDDKLTNVKIIKDNAAGVKVETSGNEYIHKTFKDADVCVTTLQRECKATGSNKNCRDIYANCKALCIAGSLSLQLQSDACTRLEQITSPLY